MLFSLLVLGLAGCAADAAETAETWNFLAIGDWGNDSPGQRATAAGMGVVASEINATKVLVFFSPRRCPPWSGSLAAPAARRAGPPPSQWDTGLASCG